MNNLFALLIVVFLIALIVGLILICIKSKRKTGVKVFIASVVLFVVSFVLFSVTIDKEQLTQTPVAQQKEESTQQVVTEQPAPTKAAEEIFYTQPDDATAFIAAVNDFRTKYNNSSNPLAKTELRSDRGKQICNIVADGDAINWVGTLKNIGSGLDDSASVAIELDKNLILKTTADTTISKANPLYYKLAKLEPNTKVNFSALLLKNDKRPDCFSEFSITESGSMDKPEYAIELKDISVYHEDPNEQAKLNSEANDKAEAAKAAGAKNKLTDEECQNDLQCLYDEYASAADVYCKEPIEKLFKYEVKWKTGFLTPMFSRIAWGNNGKESIILIGDNLSAQNGFGAWQNVTYACEYDFKNKKVLDVEFDDK